MLIDIDKGWSVPTVFDDQFDNDCPYLSDAPRLLEISRVIPEWCVSGLTFQTIYSALLPPSFFLRSLVPCVQRSKNTR